MKINKLSGNSLGQLYVVFTFLYSVVVFNFGEKFLSRLYFWKTLFIPPMIFGAIVLFALIRKRERMNAVLSIIFAVIFFSTSLGCVVIHSLFEYKNLISINCGNFNLEFFKEKISTPGSTYLNYTIYIPHIFNNELIETLAVEPSSSRNLSNLFTRQDLPKFETISFDVEKKSLPEQLSRIEYWHVMMDQAKHSTDKFKEISQCASRNISNINQSIKDAGKISEYKSFMTLISISYVDLKSLYQGLEKKFICTDNKLLKIESLGDIYIGSDSEFLDFGYLNEDGAIAYFPKPGRNDYTENTLAHALKEYERNLKMLPECKNDKGQSFTDIYKISADS